MRPPYRTAHAFSRHQDPLTHEGGDRDEPRDPGLPPTRQSRLGAPITLVFLLANILLWIVSVSLSGSTNIMSWLGLSPDPQGTFTLSVLGAKANDAIQRGEYWRLVTAMFLHGGFVHLAVNCFSLLMLGTAVERIYGSLRFFVLYLFAGLCGSIASYEFNPHEGVGSSGAIFGLAGVIIVLAVRHRERLQPRFLDEVRTVLAPLVIAQLVIGFAWPALDSMAHLGGFLGGCLLAALVETPLAGPMAMARERLPVPTALVTGLLLVAYSGTAAVSHLRGQMPVLLAEGPRRSERIVQHLRTLVRRQPDQLFARLQYAEALANAGRWSEAAAECREILNRDDRLNDVRALLGQALLATGRSDEAIPVVRAALARQPGSLDLRTLLAACLMEANHDEEAARLFREVLERRPNDARVLNNLAYTYVDSLDTRYAESVELAKRAVALEPNQGIYWDTLGWAHFKNGQLEEAAAAQERAAQLDAAYPETRYHLGVIYEAQGRREAALEEYRAALQRDPRFAPARAALIRLGSPPTNLPAPLTPSEPGGK